MLSLSISSPFIRHGARLLRLPVARSIIWCHNSFNKLFARNIDQKKAAFLEISEKSAAMRRAKKEAYFQYVYHTVGIEGNTMNLAQTRSILETKLGKANLAILWNMLRGRASWSITRSWTWTVDTNDVLFDPPC